MTWRSMRVASPGTHHLDRDGAPAYEARFDDVLAFHEPGLAPVRAGAHAWHITDDGLPAYERRFARAFGFYEGLAAVVNADGWHHITPDGRDAYLECGFRPIAIAETGGWRSPKTVDGDHRKRPWRSPKTGMPITENGDGDRLS